MLTTEEISLALGAAFGSGVIIWFMAFGVSAALKAFSVASDLPSDND